MKFMKLGSKPGAFLSDGADVRYVSSDLATDIVVHIGEVKFYLHKGMRRELLKLLDCFSDNLSTENTTEGKNTLIEYAKTQALSISESVWCCGTECE